MSMKPSGWKMGRNKKGERNAGITDIIVEKLWLKILKDAST